MIIDEDAYLAHHGVKGMKWGVRRARDPVTGKKAPRTHEEKVALVKKSVAIGGTVLVGAAVAGVIIASRRNSAPKLKVLPGERTRSPANEKWLRQHVLNNGPKVSDLKPHPVKPPERIFAMGPAPSHDVKKAVDRNSERLLKQQERFLRNSKAERKALTDRHNAFAHEENASLKKWYEDFKVPLPEREFIPIWDDET